MCPRLNVLHLRPSLGMKAEQSNDITVPSSCCSKVKIPYSGILRRVDLYGSAVVTVQLESGTSQIGLTMIRSNPSARRRFIFLGTRAGFARRPCSSLSLADNTLQVSACQTEMESTIASGGPRSNLWSSHFIGRSQA